MSPKLPTPPISAPTLYTFRRCPYAIRARLALALSGVAVVTHEVSLRDKPAAMLACSPKGTVPVLVLNDGTVIDESLDIMCWALQQHDPQCWLQCNAHLSADASALIAENDGVFKHVLDRYKYAGRYPEQPQIFYRQQGEVFLAKLNNRLNVHGALCGKQISIADIAIFPFVRQFAEVDRPWFDQSNYAALRCWLDERIASALFVSIMKK